MSGALFDLGDFAPPTPEWAEQCSYCVPDEWGKYDKQRHDANHRPFTCAVCGDTVPNYLHAINSHLVNLGASWAANALLCTSLSLRLNHLTYDKRNGREPRDFDIKALALGWTIADTGEQIPPEGWPDGSRATDCKFLNKDDHPEIAEHTTK